MESLQWNELSFLIFFSFAWRGQLKTPFVSNNLVKIVSGHMNVGHKHLKKFELFYVYPRIYIYIQIKIHTEEWNKLNLNTWALIKSFRLKHRYCKILNPLASFFFYFFIFFLFLLCLCLSNLTNITRIQTNYLVNVLLNSE